MKRIIKENQTSTKKPKKDVKCLSESKLKKMVLLFLSDKKHANLLVDLLQRFKKPSKLPGEYISAVESLFSEVLKRRDIAVNDGQIYSEAELQYKEWLRDCYEEAWSKLAVCLKKDNEVNKLQALNSLFKLLSTQAKYPIKKDKKKKKNKNNFPVNRLTRILYSLSLSSDLSEDVLSRWSEIANYKDVYCNVWLAVEELLVSSEKQITDESIGNVLILLSRLPKPKKVSDILLCDVTNVVPAERLVTAAVGRVWDLLTRRQYSSRTHQLLLVVLVGHIMQQMDNVIFLTDYLMDALAREECEINILALQGIFNLVLKHNIEYPDIFGKLYQLFTEETLKANYKTRLFVLADDFLRSTHLPLALVAGFAKRFSRLLLTASPPDMLILMTLMYNLLIRHPELSFLYHKPGAEQVLDDPYLDQEKDPSKSKATESQLWEVKLMQKHYMSRVSRMAFMINKDLPKVELELEPLLDQTMTEMIRKDIRRLRKQQKSPLEKPPLPVLKKPTILRTKSTKEGESELGEEKYIYDIMKLLLESEL